ncbi:MAG: DUF4055 domain-containing protein [Thermodesulfobacteriota bacterium]|nr:DUF4055 domain-containing protein [Thermodesulfobacteriota bacterium]
MTKLNLKQKHPVHEARADLWRYYRDHYRGGPGFSALGYLTRHQRESNQSYSARISRSVYVNYCGPIIGLYQAQLWRRAPSRSLPEGLKDLARNVDRRGSDIDLFMKRATNAAQVEGHAFILVDFPRLSPAASRLDEQTRDLRPYLVLLGPSRVIDWSFDTYGPGNSPRLKYVVIEEVSERTGVFSGRISLTRYRLWRPDRWELWAEGEPDETGQARPVKLDQGENPLGETPLVPLYNLKADDFLGESTLKDVAPLNNALYQKDSLLDEAEYWAGFPQLALFSNDEIGELELSQSRALQLAPGDRAEFLEHSGRAIDSLRETRREIKRDIFRIALRQSSEPSGGAQAESAEKRRLDRAEFISSLQERASNFEAAENQVWRLMARWLDQPEPGPVAEYNRSFDLEAVNADLGRLLIEAGDKGYLEPDQVKTELTRRGFLSG